MTNESQPLDLEREVKSVDQLQPGDVLVDYDDGILDDTYLTVRHVEPIAVEPGRYLVVFAGGSASNIRGTHEVALATADEVKEHKAARRDAEKRATVRAGLVKLIDLIDAGLPLPSYIRIEFPCMPDHESVREVAKAIGVEPSESLNGGRPQTDAESFLASQPGGRDRVEFKAWHLASKAVES